jgi:hypothetical protein
MGVLPFVIGVSVFDKPIPHTHIAFMNFIVKCPKTVIKPLIACEQDTKKPIGMYCRYCEVFEPTAKITAAFNRAGESHFEFEVEIED